MTPSSRRRAMRAGQVGASALVAAALSGGCFLNASGLGSGGSGGTSSDTGTGGGAGATTSSASCTAGACASPSACPAPSNACVQAVCVQGCCGTTNAPPGTPCTAAGSGSSVCDGNGTCVQCTSPSDCPGQDTECQQRTCSDGSCGVVNAPVGTALTSQTTGDCLKAVCDGNGATTTEDDDADVPDDNDPCTKDLCASGTPSHSDEPNGTACGAGVTCLDGICSGCVAASDCPGVDGECRTRKCTAGACGFDFAPNGTAVAAQTSADCKKNQCDGAGNIVVANDDADTPADDGNQCTDDICATGAPSHPNKAAGAACSQGGGTACNASGGCVAACSDTVKDGTETDIDCGGQCSTKCANGKGCSVDSDCVSGFCGATKTCTQQPSCQGGLTCAGVSCCLGVAMPGGSFMMGRSASGADAYAAGLASEQPEHSVTVASHSADAFEVTVGRFRAFVNAFNGTPPAANAGAHPLIANSGWQTSWNASLATSQAQLKVNLTACTKPTWTDTPGANEAMPINCVSWFEAFAFCAWDGQRLPTEAEWENMAAGGADNLLFPWGSADPSASSNKNLANDAYSDNTPLIAVGSHPNGNGKWGHRDLTGGVWEWNLDWYDAGWYSGGGSSCANCANLTASTTRLLRGGSWQNAISDLRSARRYSAAPSVHFDSIGFRCAR